MTRPAYATASDDGLLMLRLLYAAFVFFVLLRVGLNSLILNQFMDYTTLEGSTIQKIHPAFYGIVLIMATVLASYRIELDAVDLSLLRAIATFLVGIVLLTTMLVVGGRNAAFGYILDSYIVACMAIFIMTTLPRPWRPLIAELLLAFLMLSALVGTAEFALKTRLLPYPGGEEVFRPTGLSDHPLELGQWCAVGICLASATRWRMPFKIAAVAVLLIGVLASGARFATLFAGLSCLVFLITVRMAAPTPLDGLQRKIMLALAGLLAVMALIAVMFAAGALSRFDGGVVDQSALARVNIYGVFDYLTWNEFLFGGDITRIQRIALDVFGLPFIESSVVIFTVQFGLVGAILFAVLLANLFRALLKHAPWNVIAATVIFFTLSLSNNALSTKSADVLMMSLLIMGCKAAAPRATAALNHRRAPLGW
ncbi:VpsF family polysaccharide biosynthesis protein [Bradyrhizobium sp. U87765 SZCCT0131]|uniref:VpsF family polysaccharide biosynthesis protein n=1 Tax=unclassified Bradyrhizobium TaxID=2631580 RepID=UPI001BA5A925|nr:MULTISPECIES: VpsF family polysaccharide biosynthesis protein [unclassified Bradyrhizobium]MBR1219146.1 VpsF family polysaccharide biosynthesis protein [Bradyrhizobium sp. U87765 SZCCT0131]MBR1261797.1 VpsF family polysaccharide biosynthesis protein [Bradyrhizobium sp. U87765 SZCCT0134]MBR1306350.1 VpsF family polysaccharide biosynthesis protein [Bradyrhizobium sp. U87765 SZCCT0110]MBR1317579.1 VpsF family polysaccharide biosynthesis protein [Bradyrhizobium sp. U87765 SZCCT0109]MBR1351281.1